MNSDNQIFRSEYNEREKSSISPCINNPKGRIHTEIKGERTKRNLSADCADSHR